MYLESFFEKRASEETEEPFTSKLNSTVFNIQTPTLASYRPAREHFVSH